MKPRPVLKRYEEQLENLQDALAEGIRSGDRECAEAIRELVETVTVYRDPPNLARSRSRFQEA